MSYFIPDTEILIQEDFLTPEEAGYLVAAAERHAKEPTRDISLQPHPFWEDKEVSLKNLPDFNLEMVTAIFDRAVNLYEISYNNKHKNLHYKSIQTVNIFRQGVSMKVHSDRGPVQENSDIVHGFVIYLNDDYEGGEIYYPKKDITIKPKRCSLVIHPGTEEYSHGVKEVLLGTRYALTMFSRESTA